MIYKYDQPESVHINLYRLAHELERRKQGAVMMPITVKWLRRSINVRATNVSRSCQSTLGEEIETDGWFIGVDQELHTQEHTEVQCEGETNYPRHIVSWAHQLGEIDATNIENL